MPDTVPVGASKCPPSGRNAVRHAVGTVSAIGPESCPAWAGTRSYSASSPHLLAWLDEWNQGKPYEEQIRPFGFLLTYMPRTGVFAPPPDPEAYVVDGPIRGRPPKSDELKPIAPYDSDPVRALPNVFDRITGEFIPSDRLKTYAEALSQYHLSPETKFANADFFDRGRSQRRHVVVTGIVLIGKEANRIGEGAERDPISPVIEAFGQRVIPRRR